MKNADLPTATAQEPNENARLPADSEISVLPKENSGSQDKIRKHLITFAEGTQSTEVSSSQNTCSYKEVLSQPARSLSHLQKLQWLQKRRRPGLWALCDDCSRWRYLPHIIDSHELPSKWYCKLNPDRSAADCSVPEVEIKLRDEEDLIHGEYSAGSVVWARLTGWPWWPALVDDCPDTEQYYWLDGFSDIPTYYNVVFFDAFEVTRAWISPENLKPYNANKMTFKPLTTDKRYRKRLEAAIKQADDADILPLTNRLSKYSFINRYKGNIQKPKKINKKVLMRFKKQLKRKLNIDISDESSSDSDDSQQYSETKKLTSNKKNYNDSVIEGAPNLKVQKTIQSDLPEINPIVKDFQILDNSNIVVASEQTDVFKQPNSLTVQVGSTTLVNTVEDTLNIDNDSSKTYVPEDEVVQPYSSDISQSQTQDQDLQVRIPSPSSDDFEF